MSTNKELYESKMNTLADVITEKTGVKGKKTIAELANVVEEQVPSKLKKLHVMGRGIEDSGFIVNPFTFEPYIGEVDHQITEEEIQTALEQIAQDYDLILTQVQGDPALMSSENIIYHVILAPLPEYYVLSAPTQIYTCYVNGDDVVLQDYGTRYVAFIGRFVPVEIGE